MKRLLLLIIAIAITTAMTACDGGASGTPDPGNNDPVATTPDIPVYPDKDVRWIKVTQMVPGPFRVGDNPLASISEITYYVPEDTNLMDKFTSAYGAGQAMELFQSFQPTMTEADLQTLIAQVNKDPKRFTAKIKPEVWERLKATCDITNLDRELMETTVATMVQLMVDEWNDTHTASTGGTWLHLFPWEADSPTAYRNTQTRTSRGLLLACELFTIFDGGGNDITPDIIQGFQDLWDRNTVAPNGYMGEQYDAAIAADDDDPATNADRPYAWDVVQLSDLYNLTNGYPVDYNVMCMRWFHCIANEYTGSAYADRIIDAPRGGLSGWDINGYIVAAILADRIDWALACANQAYARRGDWEGELLGDFDYTPLSWLALPEGLSLLAKYENISGEPAGALLTLALENGQDYRHRSYGYCGQILSNGATVDDSQWTGWGLIGWGNADKNIFSSSNSTVIQSMDGGLEWAYTRILKGSVGLDLDGDGDNDDGAVRSFYRGNPFNNTGAPFNWESTGEMLDGIVVSTGQLLRGPDFPLP